MNNKNKRESKFKFVSIIDEEVKEEEIGVYSTNDVDPIVEVEPKAIADPIVEVEPKAIADPIVEVKSKAVVDPIVEVKSKAEADPIVEVEDYIEEKTIEIPRKKIEVDNKSSEDKVVRTTGDNYKHKISKKPYFGFEARIISMVIIVLILFASACYLILETINFGKSEVVNYSETSSVNYKVCLKDNNYYDNNCLSEDMQYVSTLTDSIVASFNYSVELDSEINYTLGYHVIATTKIHDKNDPSKVLYKSEDILVDRTDVSNKSSEISFDTNVDLEFKKYSDYVTEYNKKYFLNADADVEVALYLDEVDETRKVASIVVPLTSQTYSITKDTISNLNEMVEVDMNTWNEYNSVCAVVATVLILISLFLLYKTTCLVVKVTAKKNKYQVKLSHILREYDRIIVVAKDGYESNVEKKVVKVASFYELLDARDVLEKPIIYSRINDVKSEFIVEDDDKLFKYVLKESDL